MKFLKMIFIFVIIFQQLVSVVYADGMAYRENDLRWYIIATQEMQKAAIAHKNGREKLIITINLKLEDKERGLWIFPVPGKHEDVKIDILDQFPVLEGKRIYLTGYNRLEKFFIAMGNTQIIPIFIWPFYGTRGKHEDYAIVESVEKMGITSETVSINSLEGLRSYLQKHKIKMDSDELKSFSPYLKDNYTLVVTWISSKKALLKEFPTYLDNKSSTDRHPCVYVEFPSEKPFYPMRLTSGYGENKMRIYLTVLGYVKPIVNESLSNNISFDHFFGKSGSSNDSSFWGNESNGEDVLTYTKVLIKAPAIEFQQDILFDYEKPISVSYAQSLNYLFYSDNSWFYFMRWLIGVLLFSYISAGFAGLILFGKWNNFAKIGLWNALTVYAFYLASRYVFKKEPESIKNKLCYFEVLFMALFLGLLYLIFFLLQYPIKHLIKFTEL